jgi:hypothetical protein
MAQASSAQREPSMEEILASIRRIIEDSDSGRKAAEEAAPAVRQETELDRVARSVVEVDTFRTDLRGKPEPVTVAPVAPAGQAPAMKAPANPASVMQAPVSQEPRKMPSLADIQAEIARENAATQKAEAVPAAPAERRPVSMAEIKAEVARTAPPVIEPRPAPAAEQVKASEPDAPAPKWEPRTTPAETTSREPAPEPLAAVETQRAEAVPAPAGKPLMISEQASRQIAASFGELSEAFASRSRRTFDELAEQMMRPMLQDWLDNNLPLLVERLVREEIERVARGV